MSKSTTFDPKAHPREDPAHPGQFTELGRTDQGDGVLDAGGVQFAADRPVGGAVPLVDDDGVVDPLRGMEPGEFAEAAIHGGTYDDAFFSDMEDSFQADGVRDDDATPGQQAKAVKWALYQHDLNFFQCEAFRLRLGDGDEVEVARAVVRSLACTIRYYHPEADRVRLVEDDDYPWWNLSMYSGTDRIEFSKDCQDSLEECGELLTYDFLPRGRGVLQELPAIDGGPTENRPHVDFDPQHIEPDPLDSAG